MTIRSRRHFLRTIGAAALLAPVGIQACLDPGDGLIAGSADVSGNGPSDSGGDPAGGDNGRGAPPSSDASSADTGVDDWNGSPPDTWDAFETAQADVAVEVDDGVWPIVIAETFSLYLADTSCSGHPHGCAIQAGEYWDNNPVEVHGGHPMSIRPLVMKALEAGKQAPFHTLPHNGHHHCGTAVRYDLFYGELGEDTDKLEDFFQCVAPTEVPPDTPEPYRSKEFGACILLEY